MQLSIFNQRSIKYFCIFEPIQTNQHICKFACLFSPLIAEQCHWYLTINTFSIRPHFCAWDIDYVWLNAHSSLSRSENSCATIKKFKVSSELVWIFKKNNLYFNTQFNGVYMATSVPQFDPQLCRQLSFTDYKMLAISGLAYWLRQCLFYQNTWHAACTQTWRKRGKHESAIKTQFSICRETSSGTIIFKWRLMSGMFVM